MQDFLLNDPVYTEPGGTKVQPTLENNIVARTVRRSEALEDRLSAEVIASLGDYEIAAVRLAFTNRKVTARGLAEHIGRDRRTASRVLGKLIGEEGLLEWHGSSPKGKQARAICVESVLLVADFPEDLVDREKEGWFEVFVRGYQSIGGVESPGDARTHPIEQAGGLCFVNLSFHKTASVRFTRQREDSSRTSVALAPILSSPTTPRA